LIEQCVAASANAEMYRKEARDFKLELATSMDDVTKLTDSDGKSLAIQIQTKDTTVIDAKALRADEPDLFETYSKPKKGYRSLRVF